MGRGTSDYGLPTTTQTEYTSDDIYELAARTGVSSQVNRSGNVIFNFGDFIVTGCNWMGFSGTGGYCMPSPKFSFYGRPMLKIKTGTLSTDYAELAQNIAPFSGSQLGLECLMMMWSLYGSITLSVNNYRLSGSGTAAINIDLNTGVVKLWNAGGTWDTLSALPVYGGTGSMFAFKVSLDFTTFKYGKLWYGSEQILDLSGHSFQNTGVSSIDTTILQWQYTNNTFGSLSIYLGDVITTINELV